jgi:hypothetical protein
MNSLLHKHTRTIVVAAALGVASLGITSARAAADPGAASASSVARRHGCAASANHGRHRRPCKRRHRHTHAGVVSVAAVRPAVRGHPVGDRLDLHGSADADIGAAIRVKVIAGNAGGSAVATSASTAAVRALVPTTAAAPTIAGAARDGQTLHAAQGTWVGTAPISYTYQWLRNGRRSRARQAPATSSPAPTSRRRSPSG